MQIQINCRVTLPTHLVHELMQEFGLHEQDGKLILDSKEYLVVEKIISEYLISTRVQHESERIENIVQKRMNNALSLMQNTNTYSGFQPMQFQVPSVTQMPNSWAWGMMQPQMQGVPVGGPPVYAGGPVAPTATAGIPQQGAQAPVGVQQQSAPAHVGVPQQSAQAPVGVQQQSAPAAPIMDSAIVGNKSEYVNNTNISTQNSVEAAVFETVIKPGGKLSDAQRNKLSKLRTR